MVAPASDPECEHGIAESTIRDRLGSSRVQMLHDQPSADISIRVLNGTIGKVRWHHQPLPLYLTIPTRAQNKRKPPLTWTAAI